MRILRLLGTALGVALLITACGTQTAVHDGSALSPMAVQSAVIDFEANLVAGDFVDSVFDGTGMSGDAIPGSVTVHGTNPSPAPGSPALDNWAMIFDADCVPGVTCTGDNPPDDDLSSPSQGNVLIISEDGDPSDPDDADVAGEVFSFDFSGLGPGVVDVVSLVGIDVEASQGESASATLFGPGDVELDAIAFPSMNDGETKVVPIGVSGVERMVVALSGSGAIDDIELSVERDGSEGCTPGYWKQEHHFDSWPDGYTPDDLFVDVFGIGPEITLLEALESKGNRDGQALLRHAVAALLNAASPDVDAYFGITDVLGMVADAYSSGDFNHYKDMFDEANNLGCSLD